MRILFHFGWSFATLAGADGSTLALAKALVSRGHRVGIVQTVDDGSTEMPMYPFGGPWWGLPVAYPGRRPRSWNAVLRNLWRFQNIVSQFKPDMLSVQCPAWQSVPIVCAGALPHAWRLVVTARGSDIACNPVEQPRLRPWLRRLLRRADAVTTVSHALWRVLVDQYPYVRHKGRVIHNGVDRSWFENAGEAGGHPAPRYVLFVGRFHKIKGVDLLLHAWKRMRICTPRVGLWLAGWGDEKDNLVLLAQQLGVAEHGRFLGPVAQQDLPSLYRNAEAVVIPSRNEGLPRVALEAGACGTVSVATRVGGLPEVIEDTATGFLVEPESPAALADALMRTLRLPPEDRQRMGAAARRRIAEHFNHDRTVTDYEDLFQSFAAPAAQPRARLPFNLGFR